MINMHLYSAMCESIRIHLLTYLKTYIECVYPRFERLSEKVD